MKLDWITNRPAARMLIDAMRSVSSCLHALFWVEMEFHNEWKGAVPAKDQRLFCVSQDTDVLELDFIVDVCEGSGTLQVIDNDTGEAIWQSCVTENAVLTQRLGPLKREREYAIRFLGMVSGYMKITISSRSGDIREKVQAIQTGKLAAAQI